MLELDLHQELIYDNRLNYLNHQKLRIQSHPHHNFEFLYITTINRKYLNILPILIKPGLKILYLDSQKLKLDISFYMFALSPKLTEIGLQT